MKQNAGFAFLFALVLAGVHLFSGVPAPVAASAPAVPVRAAVKIDVAESEFKAGCTAYAGPIKGAAGQKSTESGPARAMLDTFFDLKVDQASGPQLKAHTSVRYAIALVPDPVHTNLSLMFDREMVVVQQAAQDEGYTYDSSWLPWSNDTKKAAGQQGEKGTVSHREACPGMLLFRKSLSELDTAIAVKASAEGSGAYNKALVVLVVGEQPTGGLNEAQWANAVHWLAQNAPPTVLGKTDGRTLRVLGPTFSGSLVSLDRELTRIYTAAPGATDSAVLRADFPKALILSGSVSSCASTQWFQKRLRADQIASAVRYGSFQENDELHIYRFFSYLKAMGGDVRETAILSEDETAYANNVRPADEKDLPKTASASSCEFPYADMSRPVRLSYPRDISALRAAYEKQSVFATPGAGTHAILQESAEQGSGSTSEGGDSIPAFAGPTSAVAQEAVLYGIVSYLRAHHNRYLLLRCSNPLDFLFLSRFFHRAYPEGRIVTVGSDLLFRREIETTEFRGVLALSSYALLPLNQHWSRLTEQPDIGPVHVHRVFESDKEGEYLAGRFLFDTIDPVPLPSATGEPLSFRWKESLPDYADPFWLHRPRDTIGRSQAPTWLAVVGSDGYWPVAVLDASFKTAIRLDDSDTAASPAPPSTLVTLASDSAHHELAPDRASFYSVQLLKFPLSWKICAGSCLLLMLYQVLGITIGAKRASSTGLFCVFRRFPSHSQSLLLGVNCAFAAMLFLALLSMGWTIPQWADLDQETWDFWGCIAFALGTIVAIAVVLFLDGRRPAAITFLVSLTVMGGFSMAILVPSLIPANSVPVFYRMGHLTEGISPLLPVLFLLAGMYLWTWQAMAGNAMLHCGRPVLPKLTGDNCTAGWLNRLDKKLRHIPLTTVESGWNCLGRSKYRMSREMGKRIVNMASPISLELEVVGFPLCLSAAVWVCFHKNLPLLSIESHAYSLCINATLLIAFFLTAAEAARLFWTWRELKRMLTELSRMRLRRTFAKIRAVDANSLWSVSGNVHRVQYLFFSQQLDSVIRLSRLCNLLSVHDAARCGRAFASVNASRISNGPQWEEDLLRPDSTEQVNIRTVFADATADVFNTILWQEWKKETTSLSMENSAAGSGQERNVFDMALSENETVSTAEEFVCFQYMAFIQNILARMRTMTMSMVFLFLSVCFAISFYPFVPRTQIGMWMLANLLLIGAAVIYVYAGMERDETLSYIANTRPGKLSTEFWVKTAGFLAGPLIGLLTTQFPAVAESVLGWLQPGLSAIGH